MVFYRVRKIRGKYYLVKEWYDPETGKRRSESLGNCELIEKLVKNSWCGGWDLNPRRPTPADLKSAPFVLARAPPHLSFKVCSGSVFIKFKMVSVVLELFSLLA